VSAHPGLWKAVVKLPYMVQQRCSTHGELQRCAVCYKQREVIKKFLFEGKGSCAQVQAVPLSPPPRAGACLTGMHHFLRLNMLGVSYC
jgi:hypothetical protein